MAIECIKGDAWKTASTPGKLADGGGLYLDVRSATSASWLFRYTYGGKGDEVGLGSRQKIGIERARELRVWCQEQLNRGDNPKAVLKRSKLELVRAANAPQSATVYETARDNVALIAKKAKKQQVRDKWVRSLHEDFIGYIANMAPADVTEDDVIPLLTRLYTGKDMKGNEVCKPTPVIADDIRQRLAKVLGWACRKTPGWSNPVKWTDKLEHDVDRGEHEEKNHAALPAFRVGKFVTTLRARTETSLPMRSALEWHVISATRPGEAAKLDWAWFDWANDCVVYPASVMKMGRAHRAPLSSRHHEILDMLLAGGEPPEAGAVFSVNGGDAVSVSGLRKAMHAIAKGCTLHGFRSSFSTWARGETYAVTLPTGEVRRVRLYDEALVEESLAHVVGDKTRNAYVRDDFLELRRPLIEAWASYCGKALDGKVLPMRRREAVKVAA